MFVISDTHWGHDNIVRLCGRPENHDELMMDRWNQVVGHDDLVLHLGDLCSMKGAKRDWFRDSIAQNLNGVKLLILGNHDVRKPKRRRNLQEPQAHNRVSVHHREEPNLFARQADIQFFADCGFRVVDPFRLRLQSNIISFAHYPEKVIGPNRFHVHGHIHNNGYGDEGPVPHNVNVSVEEIDYRPVRLDRLLA